MHHRLKWFIQLWAQGLSKGDEHLTNTLYVYILRVVIKACHVRALQMSQGFKPKMIFAVFPLTIVPLHYLVNFRVFTARTMLALQALY